MEKEQNIEIKPERDKCPLCGWRYSRFSKPCEFCKPNKDDLSEYEMLKV